MWKRLLLIGLVASSLAACDDDENFLVTNRSSFVLVEIHIAAIDDPTWGPNLLPDVLYPGQDIRIDDISCGTYDVLVIDENVVNCELVNRRLCFDSDTWVIDNATLAGCAFTEPRSRPADRTPQVAEPETRR